MSKGKHAASNNNPIQALLRVLQGALIGLGAVLPGISGGVLCVIFKVYQPIMEVLSSPVKALKKNARLLIPVLLGVVLWRMLSRNIYKRARENRRYLSTLERLKDRDHRYFSCPKCHQDVRVPKGKGKIAITCPQCRERFIKKT